MSSSDENLPPLSDKEIAHFEKMLPWLVNGTLSADEKKDVELALAKSEQLQQEKAFLSNLQEQIVQQPMPDAPVEFAWQKMKRQIAQQDNQQQSNQQPAKSPNTESNTVALESRRSKRWKYAAMAASVLLVIQSSTLLVSWNQEDPYRPLSSDSASNRTNAAQLTIQFTESASAIEIQTLLRRYQLTIVSGPSSIGLYKLVGPNDSKTMSDELLQKLAAQPNLIAHVQKNE